jgi:hypothetical protein
VQLRRMLKPDGLLSRLAHACGVMEPQPARATKKRSIATIIWGDRQFESPFIAGSVSLRADALDFLGDAANYAVALAVVGLSLQWRAGAALLKGSVIVRGRLVQVAILIPNRRRVICSIQLSISCASSGRA